MPIIAESPPLTFGSGAAPPVTPAPPKPPTTVIIRPPANCNLSDIIKNHQAFIDHVDILGACFKREDMPEFTEQDFEFHKELAVVDKYITMNGNSYCSMQAIQDLSQKLKRFQD